MKKSSKFHFLDSLLCSGAACKYVCISGSMIRYCADISRYIMEALTSPHNEENIPKENMFQVPLIPSSMKLAKTGNLLTKG